MKGAILLKSTSECRTTSSSSGRAQTAAADHAFGGGEHAEQKLAARCACLALLCAALFGCSEEPLADCSAFRPGAPLSGDIDVAYQGVHGTAPRSFRGAVFAAAPDEISLEACGIIDDRVWQVRTLWHNLPVGGEFPIEVSLDPVSVDDTYFSGYLRKCADE